MYNLNKLRKLFISLTFFPSVLLSLIDLVSQSPSQSNIYDFIR